MELRAGVRGAAEEYRKKIECYQNETKRYKEEKEEEIKKKALTAKRRTLYPALKIAQG